MKEFIPQPIEKVPLNQYVVDAILDAVRNGELNLGDKLPSESQLCDQFKVGRHVVREALRRLEEMAIVRTETGKGSFVCTEPPRTLGLQSYALLLLGAVDYKNLYDFRLAIESYAAYFAANNITEEKAAVLREYLEEMKASKDTEETGESFLRANHRFHKEIVKLSNNQMYLVLYNTLNDMLDKMVMSYDFNFDGRQDSYKEHCEIYEAIINHDNEAARKHTQAHILRVREERCGSD